jgi:polygalacturonase
LELFSLRKRSPCCRATSSSFNVDEPEHFSHSAGQPGGSMRFVGVSGFVLFCVWKVAAGQDTRIVKEPVIPTSCTVLAAKLQAVSDMVSEADEGKLDTERIQSALDACPQGSAVELKGMGKNNAFLSGPLELRSGVTLLINEGVTLFGSRDPKVYEVKLPDAKPSDPVKCGTSMPRPGRFGQEAGMAQAASLRRGGCRPLLAATDIKGAAIMGDGTIDGRGYAKLLGKSYSWWEMARRAEPKDDIYFSTRLIVANRADGLTLYRITLHNSPNFHVSVNGTNGFTAWGVHLLTPVDKKLDARNTDGIDPGNSSNVTIAHSWIDNGDDNIAIKSGTTHMSVLDNHFYTGHGMSIGSETVGQAYLLVDGLTEDHTSSGIRIKSNVTRGGAIHDLTYKNVCMRDVANPIAISPYYTNQTTEGFVDPGYAGTKIPDYKKIVLENVIATTPGDVLIAGLNEDHRTEITLNHVAVQRIGANQVHVAFADVTVGPQGTTLPLDEGKSVKVTRSGLDAREAGAADACHGVFVPMR